MKKPLCFLLISVYIFAFAVVRRSRVSHQVDPKPDAVKLCECARGLA